MADSRGPGSRTKARKRALDILFEADLREEDVTDILAAHLAEADPPVREFTQALVSGYASDAALVDDVIASCLSDGWTLSRMARVDRNLARLAVWELWFTDVPPAVVVDEAVGLASELSTDASPDFLNGLLGNVLRFRPAVPKVPTPPGSPR